MISRDDFLTRMIMQVGKPYIWGASGPDTFDCSGLVSFGLRLPVKMDCLHLSYAFKGCEVMFDDARPGTLFFYGTPVAPSHVMTVVQRWERGSYTLIGARGGDSRVTSIAIAKQRRAFVDCCFGDYWADSLLFCLDPFISNETSQKRSDG